jgi:hypothetical protein
MSSNNISKVITPQPLSKELIKIDYVYCKSLLNSNKVDEARAYIKRFFFKYNDNIFHYDGISFTLYKRDQAISLIPSDLKIELMIPNEETKKFDKVKIKLADYLKETDFMKDEYIPTIDFQRPLLFHSIDNIQGYHFTKNYLNMAKPLGINIFNNSNRTPKSIDNLNYVYNHIKNILCSKNEELYQYFLNFIACTFGGRKLRKALYIQTVERTGKGIIFNGLIGSILGKRMCKTNSVEAVLKYTKPFEGCCLVQPDELPHCDDYKGLQDSLKSLITEPEFICRDLFQSGYSQKNTFNVIITTNNDALILTQTNKERYICLDVSEEKIGDTKYFTQLGNILKDGNILLMFYEDMMNRFITLKNWNEDTVPMTETKKRKIIEALPMIYRYIKDKYIIQSEDLNKRTDDFLKDYKQETKDRSSNQKLGRFLSKIGITPHKNSGNQGYNYKKTAKELLEIFNQNEWMDDSVDFVLDDGNEEPKNASVFLNDVLKEKDNTIEELKKKITELENQLKNKSDINIEELVIEDEELEDEEENDEETIKITSYDQLFNMIDVEEYDWKPVEDDPEINLTDIYRGMEELVYDNYLKQKIGYNPEDPQSVIEHIKELEHIEEIDTDEVENILLENL